MNILAIDTSGVVAGVALVKEGNLAYEAVAINKLTHSVNIMPMAEEALLRGGATIADIDLLACVVGPGSFTGVRIGVSTVKALAHGMQIRCVAVNALEALADVPFNGIVCPILDARANQVYGAAFQDRERLMHDEALKLDAYIDKIKCLGDRMLFVGDGVDVCRNQIIEQLRDKACFLPPHLNHLRPSAVAYLARANADKAVDYLSLAPLYLRAPQAERERAQREAKNAGK